MPVNFTTNRSNAFGDFFWTIFPEVVCADMHDNDFRLGTIEFAEIFPRVEEFAAVGWQFAGQTWHAMDLACALLFVGGRVLRCRRRLGGRIRLQPRRRRRDASVVRAHVTSSPVEVVAPRPGMSLDLGELTEHFRTVAEMASG